MAGRADRRAPWRPAASRTLSNAMPAYARLADFRALVTEAHPGFRLAASSLRPLFETLNDVNGQAAQVVSAINAIPYAKRTRYRQALYFLAATYPALNRHLLFWPAPGRANAALYVRKAMPVPASQELRDYRPIVPDSALLGKSVEAYLLNTERVGVIVVHMEGVQPGFDTQVEGTSVISHITSVLRVAREMGHPICALTQRNLPLVAPLDGVVNGYLGYQAINVPDGHMGSSAAAYRAFAAACDCVVVCGFDADVCVMANIFGAPEREASLRPGEPGAYLRPLVSICDVVTARSIVVTGNPVIYPVSHRGEYGPLFNF